MRNAHTINTSREDRPQDNYREDFKMPALRVKSELTLTIERTYLSNKTVWDVIGRIAGDKYNTLDSSSNSFLSKEQKEISDKILLEIRRLHGDKEYTKDYRSVGWYKEQAYARNGLKVEDFE